MKFGNNVGVCVCARENPSTARHLCQYGNSVETPTHVSVPCEALFLPKGRFRELDQKVLEPLQKKNGNWR